MEQPVWMQIPTPYRRPQLNNAAQVAVPDARYMAHLEHNRQSWDDEERSYSSSRDSDDSPILSYRYDRNRRYSSYTKDGKCEEPHRRSTITVLAKFFLFCTAMILFCVLMYIPVYNKASDQLPKGLVSGWSIHTNRDTKIYVQPNNVTTIHEPKDVCEKQDRNNKNKLFLLIVVCSATTNFDRRIAIRETWGNRETYHKMYEVYTRVRNKYKDYNYTYDLYPESRLNVSLNVSSKSKRDISINRLLPELAKALQSNLVNVKTDDVPEEKRFEDEDDPVLPEFDMNKELGEQTEDYEYEYESNNIMRIPPKGGYEDSPTLGKILKMLKDGKVFSDKAEKEPPSPPSDAEAEFKLVFLLGLPTQNNDTEVQNKIDEEVEKYGDVIQEGFIDSYNNLTLKSIMMLKWITNNCNESVRYILKTDDDMYINVPNLMLNLKNRSKEFDAKVANGHKGEEYMLIGDLICGARPVLDSSNKWYSPRYMYGGRVYPRYLSGTGYALTAAAARALYAAALRTNYFHLEDIYITGMCALRASPRIVPRDDPTFSYAAPRLRPPCPAHARATAHRVRPARMRATHRQLQQLPLVDSCERWRLTQVRRERMRPKTTPKKLTKLGISMTK